MRKISAYLDELFIRCDMIIMKPAKLVALSPLASSGCSPSTMPGNFNHKYAAELERIRMLS